MADIFGILNQTAYPLDMARSQDRQRTLMFIFLCEHVTFMSFFLFLSLSLSSLLSPFPFYPNFIWKYGPYFAFLLPSSLVSCFLKQARFSWNLWIWNVIVPYDVISCGARLVNCKHVHKQGVCEFPLLRFMNFLYYYKYFWCNFSLMLALLMCYCLQ